jgi:inosine/xanthosine triphosphatase
MKKLVVASTNPIKIESARLGFARMFPDEKFTISGVSAASGVPDQPMGEEETLEGAENRADNVSKMSKDADYWIGIEGGLKETARGMEAFAWIVVKSKKGTVGRGRTGSFFIPEKVVKLVHEGKELGVADDIVFGLKNSKQSNGAVGILTNNILTRTTSYESAVILAFIPFKNPDLY